MPGSQALVHPCAWTGALWIKSPRPPPYLQWTYIRRCTKDSWSASKLTSCPFWIQPGTIFCLFVLNFTQKKGAAIKSVYNVTINTVLRSCSFSIVSSHIISHWLAFNVIYSFIYIFILLWICPARWNKSYSYLKRASRYVWLIWKYIYVLKTRKSICMFSLSLLDFCLCMWVFLCISAHVKPHVPVALPFN